ncbi:MAG: ATP-dependent helicase HrpB [Kangiellaceae bacterium]|nr:ATP-dependent helicase HrpB [Kangiellaceae bacterium]
MTLPIEEVKEAVVSSLVENQRVVLQAPPGAGKSTALPLVLLQSKRFNGKIIMLEPRRIAAISIAHYLADTLGEIVGNSVGYRVKGETRSRSTTMLELVTEGVLLRLLQSDPELEGVSLVIFDEFHERSLQADLGLALVRDIQQSLRDDLSFLVMSATLSGESLADQLQAKLITCEGRQYPIEYQYVDIGQRSYIDAIPALVDEILAGSEQSILIFLPGASEIRRVEQMLMATISEAVAVYPLYGALNKDQQQQAISAAPQGHSKIVLTTNVAETSLTIDGISVVIDCGLRKAAIFDNLTGSNRLQTRRISLASATQRAGRAGRLGPGICYRLEERSLFMRREQQDSPEIISGDLLDLAFQLSIWGADADNLAWIDHPPKANLEKAYKTLRLLALVDEKMRLTSRGRLVANWGVSPRIAAMFGLVNEKFYQCKHVISNACLIAAYFTDYRGNPEHSLFEDCLRQAAHILRKSHEYNKLLRLFKSRSERARNLESANVTTIGLLLAHAFPDRIAKRAGSQYILVNGTRVSADKLNHEWIVAVDFYQNKHKQLQLTLWSPLAFEDIAPCFGWLYSDSVEPEFTASGSKLAVVQKQWFGAICLQKSNKKVCDYPEAVSQFWSQYLLGEGEHLLDWASVEALLIRMSIARQADPSIAWPVWGRENLQQSLMEWLGPYLSDLSHKHEVQQLSLGNILLSQLDWAAKSALDELAPESWTLPTGQQVPIRYSTNQPPAISAKMPACYGLTQQPAVARGAVILTIELLSPANRPIQVTKDIHGFWLGGYREVQKEMKGRYPKHFWPDNPESASPTTTTKRHMNKPLI